MPAKSMHEEITPGGSLPDRPFSPGVKASFTSGSLLAISGQVAVDGDWQTVGAGDFEAQARQTFANINAVLAAAGATFAQVVELTAYLTDLDDFPAFDRVRREFLLGPTYPASTVVEVPRLLSREWLLEISALAVLES